MAERAWVGTSWKMNKTLAETRAYFAGMAAATLPEQVQTFVLPPLTALSTARECVGPDLPVLLGAQNAHWAAEGAWTGEVSMGMVRDAGAAIVEIGHSERREHLGETDEMIARKVCAALRHELIPLVCVGETRPVREAGRHIEHVLGQLDAALVGLSGDEVTRVMVAYEPVWAIGTSGVPAEPAQVTPILAALAEWLRVRSGGRRCRGLLYGGGVNAGNAALLFGSGADGLFVGRAGLQPAGLLALIDIVASCVEERDDE